MKQYALEHGSYYLYDTQERSLPGLGRTVHLMTDEVAVAFHVSDGRLVKHGKPSDVETWARQQRATMLRLGDSWNDQAQDLVVISGKFSVDDLNRFLTHSGSCRAWWLAQTAAVEAVPAPSSPTPLPKTPSSRRFT